MSRTEKTYSTTTATRITPPPNPALQLTAAREIGGILKASAGALAATECQPVGRQPSCLMSDACLYTMLQYQQLNLIAT